MADITLIISGMTCGGCINSVTRVLQAAPGVQTASVTLLPSQAKVTYDPDSITPAQLAQLVTEAGFAVVAPTL